jgi:thiamine pyrophosphate-dependent acetolactate synthase large subunit-like protein
MMLNHLGEFEKARRLENAVARVTREGAIRTRVIATDLHNSDFVKLAESYGALGLRVETPEALESAIRRGFDHDDSPALIEIPVGDMPSPWHLIDMPRVRKAMH